MEFNKNCINESVCEYTTTEAVNMLMEDKSKIFEYPVPNHIGMIRLVRTDDGICFWQDNKSTKKIMCNPIVLSHNTLAMKWTEVICE